MAHFDVAEPFEKEAASSGDRERLATGLGWFSIGLGLAEVAAPGRVAGLIGLVDSQDNRNALRGLGVREIATGMGILSSPSSPGWLWGRVAGDLMDLAFLASAEKSHTGSASTATAAVLGVAALDVLCASQLSSNGATESGDHMISVRKSCTVNRSPAEVYQFWRDFSNLPHFMKHLQSVEVFSDTRSRWRAKAPAGRTVEWEAEILEDAPEQRISWASVGESDVENSGSVRFEKAPGNRGTEVIVELRYDPPGGQVGALVAKLFGEEPEQQVQDDLRRFKQIMEVGEIPISQPNAAMANSAKGERR